MYNCATLMSPLDYTLLAVLAVYIIEMVFFKMGFDRSQTHSRTSSFEPKVSVIVAARNEEESIGSTLTSLTHIEYPQHKLEIVVVDDNSVDRTSEVVRRFTSRYPNLKLVNAQPGAGHLRGKANALAQGIEQSSGEILFFTDADCIVSPLWVRETVSYYTERVGIVAGLTSIPSRKVFEGMQALDWIYLLGVASAAAAWNLPLSAAGNNLSIRRSAYESVGGYQSLPFSVTEDYVLVQAIWQKTKLLIRFPINANTVVESRACSSWKDLFRQRQRWGVGGLDMVPRGFLLMSVHFAMHLLVYLSLFLMILSPSTAPSAGTFLTALGGKLLADFYFLNKPLKIIRKRSLLRYFIAFELYYSIYQLILPFIALLSKEVIWKERAFGSVSARKANGIMDSTGQ